MTRAARKLVTLSLDTQRRVEEFRLSERIASQSAAMCRLIELGLNEVARKNPTEGTNK